MHPDANFAPYDEMWITIRLLAAAAVRFCRRLAGRVIGFFRADALPFGKRPA